MLLTDTQLDILTTPAQHPERLACPPTRLPTGARQSVAKAMLRQGLVSANRGPASDTAEAWTVDGASTILVLTQQGLDALVPGPTGAPAPECADRPVGPPSGLTIASPASCRTSLRSAATALLAAWDACPSQDTTNNPISRAVEALRVVLQASQPRPAREPGAPREGTKQAAVLGLLRSLKGATIVQIMDVTGWQQHIVRGFFARLNKRQGIHVTVLERVRKVGPGAEGSRGSHSIYTVVA